MKKKPTCPCAKQILLMADLGFSLERSEEISGFATWVRRIGEPGKLPIYPKVSVSLSFAVVPTLDDITHKIIRATVEAQQERSARAMAVITGRRS